MSMIARALVVTAVLALSACTNPNRFDNDSTVDLNNNPGAGISDPSSPAYFQQAIGDRVLFPIDQSSLTDAGRAVLNGQAGWLLENGDYQAVIEGHADEQGTREYNLALGARRANAVREYLVSRGIAAARLRTVSFGKERPIEICSEESCYANNRRAVTIISGGLSG